MVVPFEMALEAKTPRPFSGTDLTMVVTYRLRQMGNGENPQGNYRIPTRPAAIKREAAFFSSPSYFSESISVFGRHGGSAPACVVHAGLVVLHLRDARAMADFSLSGGPTLGGLFAGPLRGLPLPLLFLGEGAWLQAALLGSSCIQ